MASSTSSSASRASPSPEVQMQCYGGMFVKESRTPSPVQVVNVEENVTVQKISNVFSEVNKFNIKPQFTPGDYILALHPKDNRSRYFVAEVGEKTNMEALTCLNCLKIFWIGMDGSKTQDYIVLHDRKKPVMERILPLRNPDMINNCVISHFQIPNSGAKLVGHHLI